MAFGLTRIPDRKRGEAALQEALVLEKQCLINERECMQGTLGYPLP